MDVMRMVGSMAIVIALLLAVLWGLKRIQNQMLTASSMGRLKVLETLSVGPRQKMALVRVGDHEVLIGITHTQINALGQWPVLSTPMYAQAQPGSDDVA